MICYKNKNFIKRKFYLFFFSQSSEESAKSEPAWSKAGKKPGLQIWRIIKFQVVEWPVSEYGSFYNGDSYIVLNVSDIPLKK
jgi:hypothetical protein